MRKTDYYFVALVENYARTSAYLRLAPVVNRKRVIAGTCDICFSHS